MVAINFVLLKEWVSEYEDFHNDKTNTQRGNLPKLLSINNAETDHKHHEFMNIEGKAEVRDALIEVVRCRLS